MNPRDFIESGDPRWKESRVCGSKTKLSERDAWNTAHKLRSAGDDDCHAYRCPYCGHHHIGFQNTGKAHRSKQHSQQDNKRRRHMRESEEFDVQDDDETSMLNDPAYIAKSAGDEAAYDYDMRISMSDGIRKLLDRGASDDEITAYTASYNTEYLRAVARDAGIPEFVNPFRANEKVH